VNQLFIESIHRANLSARAPDPAADSVAEYIWAAPAQLARLSLSGPHRRWVEELRKTNTIVSV
jgi:hypothetical protein